MTIPKYTSIGFTLITASITAVNAALVQPAVNHILDGPGDDVYFANSAGNAFGSNEAYIFYGTFDDISQITSSSTAQEIEDGFLELGINTGDSNDVYSASPTFSQEIEGSQFEGRRGYLIAANSSDIGSATEIAIVSNSSIADWTFNTPVEPAATKTYTISSTDYLQSTTGVDLVLGSYQTAETGYQFLNLSIVAVPEPSSLALLGLGATALLFRRRK